MEKKAKKNAVAKTDDNILEKVLIGGDLSGLSTKERVSYMTKVCETVGLNPLTKPFDYIVLNQKLVLYASKGATDQLRKVHSVSLKIISREKIGSVYVVTAEASLGERTDSSTGAVPLVKEESYWSNGRKQKTGKLVNLFPDEMANAMMKAETKAKRRVTLSICGLGLLDESELDTINPQQPPARHENEVKEKVAPIKTEEQKKVDEKVSRILSLFKSAESSGWSKEQLKCVIETKFKKKKSMDLTLEEIENFENMIQNKDSESAIEEISEDEFFDSYEGNDQYCADEGAQATQ